MTKDIETAIKQWKQQHGDVFEISVAGKQGYFRSPDRTTLSLALSKGTQDPLGYSEVIATNCWLGGDKALLEDDKLFLSVCTKLGALLEMKEARLKKY